MFIIQFSFFFKYFLSPPTTSYYFEIVASFKATNNLEGLKIALDAVMFDTALTNKDTVYATNAQQIISIESAEADESYSIEYDDFTTTGSALGEQQSISMDPSVSKFVLRFMGVTTAELRYGITAKNLEAALNDLPILYPDLVSVTEVFDISGMWLGYLLNYSNSFLFSLNIFIHCIAQRSRYQELHSFVLCRSRKRVQH